MPNEFIVRVDGQDYLARNGSLINSTGGLVNMADAFQALDKAISWGPILQSDTGADDSDKIITVPAGKEWMVQSVRIDFTTTVSTGDRQLVVQIQSTSTGSVVINEFVVGVVQGASLTYNYNFGQSRPDATVVRDTVHVQTPIDPMILRSGTKIRIFDNNAVNATGDDMIIRLSTLQRTAVSS